MIDYGSSTTCKAFDCSNDRNIEHETGEEKNVSHGLSDGGVMKGDHDDGIGNPEITRTGEFQSENEFSKVEIGRVVTGTDGPTKG